MASHSFRTFVEQKLGKFPHFLIYAILEWVMIILLFIDGFLSFISNEFAKFFELDIPCLLCTRIDHVFVHRDPTFYYNDSICEDHKKHISSLAYCHVHKKLSDLRNMCEGCLLSFAMEKDSDFDKQRSLVGIFHKDLNGFLEGDQKTHTKTVNNKKEDEVESSCTSWCSCCGDPLKARKSSKFTRNYSINNNSIAPTPSPRAPFLSLKTEEIKNVEMPHIQYSELKFFSDTESELPDEDDASIAETRRKEDMKAVIIPLLQEVEEINEDTTKTPLFARGNRFFGVPLSESAQASPRYNRAGRKMSVDMMLDPIDMNALCEGGDNELILNRLKRQVRIDRKTLIALYMELDEERSASAVAVNNAMAMITRLQAEKAAVQMEALQYQRMMEEQAEYDQEAIQDLKDLALRREEEIKVLESELEFYRERYGPVMKISSDICEIDGDDDYQELKSQFSAYDDKSDCSSPGESDHRTTRDRFSQRSGEFGSQNLDDSYLDFESERSYILGFITDLEKELNNEEHDIAENEKRSNVAKEMQIIRERLRDFESDIGFIKNIGMNVQKGGDGVKFLMEIAQHLRNLRRYAKKIPENTDALASAS